MGSAVIHLFPRLPGVRPSHPLCLLSVLGRAMHSDRVVGGSQLAFGMFLPEALLTNYLVGLSI